MKPGPAESEEKCVYPTLVSMSPVLLWAGLGWAGLGWAGLGWARGNKDVLTVSCEAQGDTSPSTSTSTSTSTQQSILAVQSWRRKMVMCGGMED